MAKFVVDVRKMHDQVDMTILETEDFREALKKYDDLSSQMAEHTTACDFDIVIMYVKTDSHANPGDDIPVVMSIVEVRVVET